MKKRTLQGIDVEIDDLTNSIKNVISGDSFQTDISRINKSDLKNVTKISGWQFDWKLELKHPERDLSQLIDHYVESLGTIHFGGRVMIIDTNVAYRLINKYFTNII